MGTLIFTSSPTETLPQILAAVRRRLFTAMAGSAHGSTIKPTKHPKVSENSSDMISYLPEPILHHILSFLPTKDAARTSVLSKQWQHLWTWLPNLDLNWREIHQQDKTFEQIVFDVLNSRRSSFITKFTLSCEFECDFCLINDDDDDGEGVGDCECDSDFSNIGLYLSTAVSRNVQELDFCLMNHHDDKYDNVFQLPQCLFSAKTLVVLKLRCDMVISIDSSAQFPNLKVLHLHKVKYKDDDSVRNLFSGCPVLDELDVQRFELDDVQNYRVSSLTVRNVVLLHDNPERDLSSNITVNAPALECLTVEYNGPPGVLVLENMDNLVRANVAIKHHISWTEPVDFDWEVTMDIFRALRNVQYLEMTFDVIAAPHHYIVPTDNFPVFENLVELKIGGFCCLWRLLVLMLQKCPQLQHLTLVRHNYFMYLHSNCEDPECWMPPKHIPNCLSTHLTTFKFHRLETSKPERQCIQYVLKNAKVLSKMVVGFTDKDASDAVREITIFEKGSGGCQLNFEETAAH